jgi:hypothetical protein
LQGKFAVCGLQARYELKGLHGAIAQVVARGAFGQGA